MPAMNFSLIAQTFAEQLPVCLVGGTAVVLLAWALLRVTARDNPGVRFRVWLTAMFALAALLFSGAVRPGATSVSAVPGDYRFSIQLSPTWAVCGFVVWLSLASAALVRILIGVWQIHRLRSSCVEIHAEQLDAILRDCVSGRSKRRVALCVSDRVTMPTAVGLGRPAIIMPAWALRELSPSELKHVILHELAHLQRWDDWTNLAQKVLRAFLIFHPLAWWVESRLMLEREMACDDAVLRQTESATAYARCLAALAEKSFLRRSAVLAQAAVSRVKQTSLRVARILRLTQPSETRKWVPSVAFVALFSFAGLVVLHAPRVIGFEESAAPSVEARASLAETSQLTVRAPVVEVNTAARSVGPRVFEVGAKLSRPAVKHPSLTNQRMAGAASHLPAGMVHANYVLPSRHIQQSLASGELGATADRDAMIHQAVLVVMADQPNSARAVMWEVTVWRVTFSPDQRHISQGTTPKKT